MPVAENRARVLDVVERVGDRVAEHRHAWTRGGRSPRAVRRGRDCSDSEQHRDESETRPHRGHGSSAALYQPPGAAT